MIPSEEDQSSPSKRGGHAPIFSKKRKTATRGRRTESSRPGGVQTLVNLFGVTKLGSSPDNNKSTSSYIISKHGEQTSLEEGMPQATQAPATHLQATHLQDQSLISGDKGPSTSTIPEPGNHEQESSSKVASVGKVVTEGETHRAGDEHDTGSEEYSAEARTYHAWYDEVRFRAQSRFASVVLMYTSSRNYTMRATTQRVARAASNSLRSLVFHCGHASRLFRCLRRLSIRSALKCF
jgi:hypothetical protein